MHKEFKYFMESSTWKNKYIIDIFTFEIQNYLSQS